MAIKQSKAQIKQAQKVLYEFYDILDPSHENSNHYKEMFSKMSDEQFIKFVSKPVPFRFHTRPFEIEPTLDRVKAALDFLGVPLLEVVSMPYQFKDKDGNPVQTESEQYIVYLNLKKMQQFITHKNAMSTDINMRDMKNGLLNGGDKNGKTSDKEVEALVVQGLDKTTYEFTRAKADSMDSKSKMYNTISIQGRVRQEDIKTDNADSLSRNLLNVYLLGANIKSNIISDSYYLPYTIKNRDRVVKSV